MKKVIGFKTIKTGIGATIAMLVAQLIGLKFTTSAGIITILSIQNTRKESIQIAMKRMLATCIALVSSGILFFFLGFHPVVFGLYLILYIPIAVKLKVTEGIVPASVLVTHLLAEESIALSLMKNELLLMLVGASVALILNLYMPSIEKDLLKDKETIEEEMYHLFMGMSKTLENNEVKFENKLDLLEQALISGTNKARQNAYNAFIHVQSPYEKYFEMRANQYQVIKYMIKHFDRFFRAYEQNYKVAEFTKRVAQSVKGQIVVEELLQQLEVLRINFKTSELPVSRAEFENRALLYQFLNDIEQFLTIKKIFKEQLSSVEREEYNKYYKYN